MREISRADGDTIAPIEDGGPLQTRYFIHAIFRDNDDSDDDCAALASAGWWFNACSDFCLNCAKMGWVYMEYDDRGDDKREHLPQETQMALRPTP